MAIQTHTNSGRSPSLPKGTFTLTSPEGIVCDLTELIANGAKLTVLIDRVRAIWNVPSKPGKRNDWVYYRVYNAVKRWNEAGSITKQSKAHDPYSLEFCQKSGVYVRAVTKTNKQTPCLINDLQNSKSFAAPQKRLRLDHERIGKQRISDQCAVAHAEKLNRKEPLSDPIDVLSYIPGRCGWYRAQAIKIARSITTYEWFVRDKDKNLNPELKKKLRQMQLLFEAWKEETLKKSIVLRKVEYALDENPYITFPCATRFTDDARKRQLIFTYMTGVENSLKKFTKGVFLTLTTDPAIWMKEKGKEFQRKIPDPHIDKVHHFAAVGKGSNFMSANRHESTAFRKWYEAECQRRKHRIPYIRVPEFQENGLIHDHILLFDIDWDHSFNEMAKRWGIKYSQGFMHDVYEVVNDGEKWVWKHQKPNDTQGRDPTDYLKKYLIKCLYDESGHSLYWVHNKRFFTMSETVRYLTTDEKIAQADFLKEHKAVDKYEFIGAVISNQTDSAIDADIRRRDGLNPHPPVIPVTVITNVKTKADFKKQLFVIPVKDEIENPNQGCEIIESWIPPPQKPSEDIRQLEYERWQAEDDKRRAEETRLMKERRKRLKERSGSS